MQLQNFDATEFLQHYWQRKPLLIRQAVPDFQVPLDANELAGLAMEAEVESRIVIGSDSWEQLHGPFTEADFAREDSWTLLVQAVDQYLPEAAELLRLINFLPGWRVDDVMVSYASDGGSVGPHYDNYDVFLLQGEGQREWLIGQACDAGTELLAHPELMILADFQQSEAHLLQPGDMLYLPPRLAHWGIARGECTTFSLGLRAPRLSDLMSRMVDQALEALDPEQFYRDPALAAEPLPGEITASALDHARTQLLSLLQTHTGDGRWLGELVTEPRYPLLEPAAEGSAASLSSLRLAAGSKLAWSSTDQELWVFANGESFKVARECLDLLIALCDQQPILEQQLEIFVQLPQNQPLIDKLLQMGCVNYE